MSGTSTSFRLIWLGTPVLVLVFGASAPYSSPESGQALAQPAESSGEGAADVRGSSDTEARLREAEQRAEAVLADDPSGQAEEAEIPPSGEPREKIDLLNLLL